MPLSNPKDSSFRKRLILAFSGSALILLLAGWFALSLLNQLSEAVDRTVSKALPETLVAMRLSERSALLAASAPSLTNARDREQTRQIAASLDQLKTEIDSSVTILEQQSEFPEIHQIRDNVAELSDTLSELKSTTNRRIALNSQHGQALGHVRTVHNELVDTVSPVVWGVTSLTRLFGKRAVRSNALEIKKLRDRQVPRLGALLELQTAFQNLTGSISSDTQKAYQSVRQTFVEVLEHALELLSSTDNEQGQTDLLGRTGTQLLASWPAIPVKDGIVSTADFSDVLAQMLSNARTDLARQFSTSLRHAKANITNLVDQTVQDMSFALDIKAEGNLLFSLLTAAAEADSRESISSLRDRFKRSHHIFQMAANAFLKSRLSLRNPILSGNVSEIQRRLQSLGEGPDSLFSIRRQQLTVLDRIQRLLTKSRVIAAQLKLQVQTLVDQVQGDADRIQAQLAKSRGTNRVLLILVFSIGLMLLAVLAFFTIRILEKQDRDLRQAATVFESTGEGVIITNPESDIVAVNNAFSDISGYEKHEILGKKPSILHSGRHRAAFYEEMWNTIKETGRWQGEIFNRKKDGSIYPEWLTINAVRDNHGNVSQYVAVFSDITIVKRSLEKLDHLAHHDPLTGLPNRLLLRDRLKHAIQRAHREKNQVAVLFLDLDRFKNINDTLGHTVGDNLLCLVAERLSNQLREEDTVARLGGDEFMILVEDISLPSDAGLVAQKILDSFHTDFHFQEQEFYITFSIGISLYPDDGQTVDKLIRNSDAAMYRAKEKGKNNYQYYTSELTVAALEKLQMESSLRLALERREFELGYQPQWNVKTGGITGVEALLRWRHPERGLLAPAEFLWAAEESGLILPIGNWVLQTACHQAQKWQEAGLPAIQMSINLSRQQITKNNLIKTVADSLKKSRLDPEYLVLEITEDFIMQQPDEVIGLLDQLRDMGICLAIDDFGTGYSSLSYLKQLPIQKLKIDRSFIRDIPGDADDMAITRAILALGHSLKMSIIAEGVETEEQRAFLLDEGCDEAQGYLFSAPLPADAVERLIRTSRFRAQLPESRLNTGEYR